MKGNRDNSKAVFMPFLVLYGPNDANVGIKGIRSDAPKEAIDAFLYWYRDNHRYPNGRMMNNNDPRLEKLIIDVSDGSNKNDKMVSDKKESDIHFRLIFPSHA